MKQLFYRISLGVSLLSFLAAVVMLAIGQGNKSGPVVVAFLAALALGMRGSPTFRGFSYTVMILAAVTKAQL